MGSVITYSNIESQAYSNIYEIVDNRGYIVDPRQKNWTNSTTQKRKFVYDSDPFNKAVNFSDMPYIIVELPVVTGSVYSVGGKYEIVSWSHRIIVRCARDGASNTTIDVGRTDILDICDDLQQTFNSTARREEMAGWNMRKIVLEKVSVDTYAIDGSKDVYEAIFDLKYESRMAVST